ncbi:MAG TPA: tripartite tricarboxylate transporter substrate-binding protein [Alphaproteobacteria bacterium]|jgi:tripartite-type tricarboxylate transporter receptor subunit TctC|nr:tripartite tricarboxylate transporter substrate-binding protein [Alphaproteobacteria bacterium]
MRNFTFAVAASVISTAMLASGAANAQDFLGGKQLKMMVATPPGGGYDAYGRLVARHMRDYLPGRPNIVVNNMAGASGITGTNWLYEVAPRDGTVIGTFNKSEPFYQAIGQKGVRFKAQEFGWIGAMSQAPDTINVSNRAGVKTIEDVKKKEVIIGADSGGTMTLYPALLNSMIGTKFKIITGYAGSAAVYLAIEKDEVQGVGSTPWTTWKATRPDWVREGRILALVQVGLKKDPDLANVPRMIDLAENDEERVLFTFVSSVAAIERPYAAPPGIPAEALATWRKAFDQAVKDKALIAEAEKMNLDLDPQDGETVAKIVSSILTTPPEIIAKVRAFVDEGR